MQKKIIGTTVFLALVLTLQLAIASTTPATKPVSAQTQTPAVVALPAAGDEKKYTDVNPVAVVDNPQQYLNKSIRVKGIFDKFSIVGLDYKPAFRNSEDYILFLIRRNEIKGHVIPLAEMKIFIKRKDAEKFIDLEAGDEIQFEGKVFSTALGDPWVDVESLKILRKVSKPDAKK